MIGGSSLNARLPLTLKFTGDDRDLYGGLFRLHVLHHAGEKPLYGHWMIEESRHHGYEIGPGTTYPLLHPNPKDSDLKLRSCFRNSTDGHSQGARCLVTR
jgi:hypothetical protein